MAGLQCPGGEKRERSSAAGSWQPEERPSIAEVLQGRRRIVSSRFCEEKAVLQQRSEITGAPDEVWCDGAPSAEAGTGDGGQLMGCMVGTSRTGSCRF